MASLSETSANSSEASVVPKSIGKYLPESIFRAYDIRGIVDEQLSVEGVGLIGQAVGSEALAQGISTLLLAYDGRLSSPELSEALKTGIMNSGCNVVVIGLLPTPLLYFATHTTEYNSGVMLTASHNPANYNGLKIVFNKTCLADNQIANIRQRIINGELMEGAGTLNSLDVSALYIETICKSIQLAKPLRIVIDCGNAVPAVVAPKLFEALGCEVKSLYCELDGRFPNHHPDPTITDNLKALANTVEAEAADLGIAFDGDGDRLGVITNKGNAIEADRLLMLLVQSIADRYQGESVVFDVKCSAKLPQLISDSGMKAVMHRSGHSFMKQKMSEMNAPIGGEFAAHIFIQDRWYGFDDGIYTAARVLEILSLSDHSSEELFASFAPTISTPEIKVSIAEERKFSVMDRILELADFPDAKILSIDGLRVEFPDGWGLVRASNTSPALLLRFEADSEQGLSQIKSRFKALIQAADNSLVLNL